MSVLERIENRSARVVIVGLGYVGLPLSMAFTGAGFTVDGIDINPDRVGMLNRGESYIPDVSSGVVRAAKEETRFTATTSFEPICQADAVVVCVPTPLRKTGDPDISFIVNAFEEVSSRAQPGLLVVLESTTYPGTTEEVFVPELTGYGLNVGTDVFCAYSPERIDPGNHEYKLKNTPKVLAGVTPACFERARALYSAIVDDIVEVSSPKVAEMVKLLENTYRGVNIGLVNEVAIMCQRLGVDVWEVINAAATKPFGFTPFYPGPGIGGHCIGVDPQYLSWKLRSLNYTARFIDLATEVNARMPEFIVFLVTEALNEREMPVKGAKVLIIGVTYKRDAADTRESPAIDIIAHLRRLGAEIAFHDSFITEFEVAGEPVRRVQGDDLGKEIEDFDVVVLVTDHSTYDIPMLVDASSLLIDCRGATQGIDADPKKLVRL